MNLATADLELIYSVMAVYASDREEEAGSMQPCSEALALDYHVRNCRRVMNHIADELGWDNNATEGDRE